MKKLLTILMLGIVTVLSAQYNIKIHVDNYSRDSLFISYPNGIKPHFLDTIPRDSNGVFIFQGKSDLEAGVYFVGEFSNKQKYRIIVTPKDNDFEVYFNSKQRLKIELKKSLENEMYKDYLLLSDKYKLQTNLYGRGNNQLKRDSIFKQFNKLRFKFIEENPNTIVSLLVKSEVDWVNPINLIGDSYEDKILDYKIEHFLDNIDLSNPISFRLPLTHRRIIYYFDNVVHAKPSDVNNVIGRVLNEMGSDSEMYKYYLPLFLKRYKRTYEGWFDSTYLFIARNYYNKVKTPWLSDKLIDFVQYQADRKESTLIGKIIPDVSLAIQSDDSIRLLDINADFIVLVFWKPSCSHCKKAMPYLNELKNEYEDYNLKIVTVCSKRGEDVSKCWDGIKNENMNEFQYNLVDRLGSSKFYRKFNISSVPMIFILDKDKRIIDKSIKAKNLKERIEEIINLK